MIIINEGTKAIFERQTVREYKDIPLNDDELETLMKAALLAPSGRNSQPCHARFVTDKEALKEINIDFKNYVGWDTPAYTRAEKNPVYHNAPLLVLIFSENGSKTDCGIMVENIALCAQAIGLNSVIIGSVGALFDSPEANKWKKRLDIPENFCFDIAVAVGHGDETPEPKPRDESHVKLIKSIHFE